ncbi:CGNR zinc finger domain-containing protein [Kitasatospora sp. NBC_01287]|uniref:CGNR zinc finger domain-containing protein n=1 Tax=Kitasatospora sp. NBC_01287 TaxID=2903573 RepID=UPI00224EAD74|nr:CGNR zinc finger domain-containing protein [Kitasatospora sp. NBC_01287]MCX4745558.1 CGNR zinc finger domain-containing protein [Kitasatospora sp. NBC_01287]
MSQEATSQEAVSPEGASPEERPADPRPLPDEPLSLDLLNTRWNNGGSPRDLLDSLDGLALWLALRGFADRVPADRATQEALLATRAVLGRLVDQGDASAEARAALNEVLAHGAVRRTLEADGPHAHAETDAPAWLPAWAAAEDYLRLLDEGPDRIRSCASDSCVLRFYDTSKNGTRRWHSMASCGNRAKAARHYGRTRSG